MFNFLRVSAAAVFLSLAACGTQSVQKAPVAKPTAATTEFFQNSAGARGGDLLGPDRRYNRCVNVCLANGGGNACFSKCR